MSKDQLEALSTRSADLPDFTKCEGSEACNDCCCDLACDTFN